MPAWGGHFPEAGEDPKEFEDAFLTNCFSLGLVEPQQCEEIKEANRRHFAELGGPSFESSLGQVYQAGYRGQVGTCRSSEKGPHCNRCREALYECTCPAGDPEDVKAHAESMGWIKEGIPNCKSLNLTQRSLA